MDSKKSGFSTKAIHVGQEPCKETGALAVPLYQTSTFALDNLSKTKYVYTRTGNPTTTVLEEKMAALEGGEAALGLASGMAAISHTILTIAQSGDHVICDDVVYGCTYDLFSEIDRFGIEKTFVDTSDLERLKSEIKSNTKLIFLETPTNPTLKMSDLKAISEIAGDFGAKVVVDNTFMTPYFQRPLELGVDVVVHSATKYISGHGDTIAGVAVGEADFIDKVRKGLLKDIGGAISPFNAWLLIRGLKTLSVRMERHEKNAMKVAEFLEGHPKVEKAIYPGLKSHPQYDIGVKQMDGFGGMVSFEVKNSAQSWKVINNVKLCTFAVSLGDVDTLIQIPSFMTHKSMPKEEKLRCGITDGLIRLSVGIEDVDDIIGDLNQALDSVRG
ncbi:MAG: PLP-dependent aspartate aminotransferase family protein [Halobacteriota archaeon]|nr:PLP-dependent aspartate aminotransferase family protein [Halobacteriota archaeon]